MSTKTQKLRRSATLVLVLTLLVSLVGTIGASAASSPVTVTDVSAAAVGENNTVELGTNSWVVSNNYIVGTAGFHTVGDAIRLTVTVKNNDGVPYKVTAVKDDIDNDYLEFDYSEAVGKTLKTSGTTDLYITVKYAKGVGSTYDEIIQKVEKADEKKRSICEIRPLSLPR